MAVVLGVVALLDPDVDHVEYLVMHLIAGGDFLIENLVGVIHAGVEVRLADCAVHTRLIHLVEGDLRSRVLIVLEPQAYAFRVHFVLGVEGLHHPNVRGVAPVEEVSIFLRDALRHLHALIQEVHVVAIFLGVVLAGIRALVFFLVADSLGIVQADVVRRIAVHDVREVASHELLHQFAIGRVANEQPMFSKLPDLSGLNFRLDRLLECLLDIKVVIDHVNVIEEVLKLLVAEADIKEYAHVEVLEEFLVPRAGVLVEAEVEFSLFLKRQLSGRHHALDLLDSEVCIHLHTLFAADDGVGSCTDVEDNRDDRAECLHGLLQVPAFVLA